MIPLETLPRLGLLLALGLALACNRGKTPAAPLEPVRTNGPATKTRAPARASGFIGVVVAGEAADIEPKAEGRIEEVFVAAGDVVAAGAPLARLDGKALRHELDMARAALKEANRRFARRRQLSRTNTAAITTEELEGAERELRQEQARVARLGEAVAEAVVTAPFAGTVAERYLAAGALSGPGRPLVRLIGGGQPRVRFAIPEDRAAGVVPGRQVDVAIAPLGLTLKGRISGVSPEVDASSRMVFATASLDAVPVPAVGAPRLSTGVITRVHLVEGLAAAPGEGSKADASPAVAPAAAAATTLAPPAPITPPATSNKLAAPPRSRPARKKATGALDKW